MRPHRLFPIMVLAELLLLQGCGVTGLFGGGTASSSSSVITRKTYRSEKHSFELTYPVSWTVSEESSNRVMMGSDILFFTGDADLNAREGISVDAVKRPMVNYTVGRLERTLVLSKEDMTVGGEPAKKVLMRGGAILVFVQHKNFLYTFVTGGRLVSEGVVGSVRFLR